MRVEGLNGGRLELGERDQVEKQLRDLMEIIQFTENVSARIHGLLDEAEIYRTVREEFAKSKRYNVAIFLLTDDGSKLRIADTSLSTEKVKAGEKAAGLLSYQKYRVDLNKSSYLSQVVREGKTIEANFTDVVSELFPRPLAYLISKVVGYEKRSGILTPLKLQEKIIGVLVIDTTELAKYYIPSVRTLAQHISNALELADEYAERKRYEEQLEALHRHAAELASAEKVEEVAESTFNAIEQVLGFNMGSFGIVEGSLLRHILVRGVETEEAFEMPLDGRGITVRAVRTGETQFVPDIREDEDYVIGLAEGLFEALSELTVPVKIAGEVVAVINVESTKLDAFTDGDRRLLEIFAEHVASAIGRLRHVEMLRASEERWRTLLEASMDAVTVNVGTELVYVNRGLADLLGYSSPSELIGRDLTEFDAPEYREMIRARTLRRQRGEEVPERYELKLLRRNGTQIDVETLTSLIEYEGKPAALSFVRDITERKKVEEALKESEEWHRAVFEGSQDAIFITGADSRFVDVNEAAEILTGYSREELIGMSIADLHDVLDLDAYESFFDRIMAGEPITSEAEILRKDGIKIPTEFSNRRIVIRGVPYMHTSARDITKRKQAEEALRRSEQKYRQLVENVGAPITYFDINGEVLLMNTIAARVLGGKPEDFVGKKITVLFPADEADKYMKRFSDISKTGQGGEFEDLIELPSGNQWFGSNLQPVRDMDGKIFAVQIISYDITERKKMEEKLREYAEHLEELVDERTRELRESEDKFRGIAERSFDAIFTLDPVGYITFMSPAAERITGYRPEEFIDKPFQNYLPEAEIPKTVKAFTEALKSRNVEGLILDLLRKDGTIVTGEFNTSPIIKDGEVVGIQVVGRDITKRKQMEEALRNAERLAAIGETAAMVGHDLRNPLQVIVNTIYLMKETFDNIPSTHRKILEEQSLVEPFGRIEEQVEYMNKIVSDLQDYARPLKPQLLETSLNQLINDTLSSITIPETVKVSIALEENFPKLMVDPALMRRVITNLVTNALQAMPDGGRLKIRASKTEETASISVKDTGVGIPEEDLPKLFQPLFTTKPRGQGLGLPVCRRLVEAHDGTITVESQVGRGSTFTVQIPLKRR